MMSSEGRGITTGLSLLVQKSLVSRTKIIEQFGVGPFYQLYLGVWRQEQVLVKWYDNNDSCLWKNETVLYQVNHELHSLVQLLFTFHMRIESHTCYI